MSIRPHYSHIMHLQAIPGVSSILSSTLAVDVNVLLSGFFYGLGWVSDSILDCFLSDQTGQSTGEYCAVTRPFNGIVYRIVVCHITACPQHTRGRALLECAKKQQLPLRGWHA